MNKSANTAWKDWSNYTVWKKLSWLPIISALFRAYRQPLIKRHVIMDLYYASDVSYHFDELILISLPGWIPAYSIHFLQSMFTSIFISICFQKKGDGLYHLFLLLRTRKKGDDVPVPLASVS